MMRSATWRKQMLVAAEEGTWGPPTGLRILVPGLPQWSWRQRGRAGVLFGSYVSAVSVGLFSWGTPAGLAMLAFAFLTHVVATADVVRQRAFPGFGRWVPMISASAGLGLGYAPFLGSLLMIAWPGERAEAPSEGYLINLWAYRHADPESGHWVWYRHRDESRRSVGRVLARSGQEAEWREGRLQVDGQQVEVPLAVRASDPAWTHLVLRVPAGSVLVAPLEADGSDADGPVLVDSAKVWGRVWARYSPVWDRRFLP